MAAAKLEKQFLSSSSVFRHRATSRLSYDTLTWFSASDLAPPRRSRRNAAFTGAAAKRDKDFLPSRFVFLHRVTRSSRPQVLISAFRVACVGPFIFYHAKSFYSFVPRPPCTSQVQPENSSTTDQPVQPPSERENENLTGCLADRTLSFRVPHQRHALSCRLAPCQVLPTTKSSLLPSARMRTLPVVSQTVLYPFEHHTSVTRGPAVWHPVKYYRPPSPASSRARE